MDDPVSRDTVSHIRLLINSIPPGWATPVHSIPLKLVKRKTQTVNAEHFENVPVGLRNIHLIYIQRRLTND